MSSNFKIGDLVWARMKSYPAWPAIVSEPTEARPKLSKGQVHVTFFGTKPTNGYVPATAVLPYDNSHKDQLSSTKTGDFKIAMQQAEDYKKEHLSSTASDVEEPEVNSDDGNNKVDETPKKREKAKRKHTDENGESSNSTSKILTVGDSYEMESKRSKPYANVLNLPVVDRPDSPTVDFSATMELLQMKNIEPSKLKFGFLGLGIMGQRIVKNLILSGHHVNVWNRTPEKCDMIKKQADEIGKGKVEIYIAPCEVMENSDIVFSCLFDSETAKKYVFENCGVIQQANEILDGKGYVEMTGIDSEVSKKIGDEITRRGGRYLEAQIQGSKNEAEEGSLLILTAGNKTLFNDCQSCFKAIGKSSLYLGEVGVGTKICVIIQMMKAISLAGLAEGLVLADRCGISSKDILNILKMTNLACPYLIKKAEIIVNKDFTKVEHSIKNMQKDLRLGLALSEVYMQPLMMTSAANEVYKHSRKLGYDEHDCACIYMKTRY